MKINKNITIALGLIFFCIFNYFYLIPNQVIKQGSSPHYPLIIITFILFFSILYLVLAIIKKNNENVIIQEGRYLNRLDNLRVIITIILLILYVNLIEVFGFILTTTITFIMSIFLYGSRDYFKMGLILFLFSLILSYAFRILLHSTLPGGILEQLIFGW